METHYGCVNEGLCLSIHSPCINKCAVTIHNRIFQMLFEFYCGGHIQRKTHLTVAVAAVGSGIKCIKTSSLVL